MRSPTSASDRQHAAAGEAAPVPFEQWFAGSVVTVDGSIGGAPLVLYHGTAADFEHLRPDVDGLIYLTASEGFAQLYAERALQRSGGRGCARIIAVHLALRNPLEILGGRWNMITRSAALQRAKQGGHDGIVLRCIEDTIPGKGNAWDTYYIAFRPEQIRSAPVAPVLQVRDAGLAMRRRADAVPAGNSARAAPSRQRPG